MIKILVTVILLSGPFASVNEDTATWKSKFDHIGVNVQIVSVIRRPDFEAKLNALKDDAWMTKLARAKAWLKRQPTKGIRLIINPPIIEGNALYSGGISDVCKPKDGTSIAYVDDQNAAGEDRTYNKQIIIAHELGHVLGASHDNTIYSDGASIMQSVSASPAYIHPNMEFSQTSIKQILKCVK